MIPTIRVLAIAVAFVVTAFAQSDEELLRSLVGKYFDAFARKDWATMESIWHKNSPGKGQRFEVFPRQFADGDLSFSSAVVSRLKMENSAISLRVATRRTVKQGNTTSITDVRIEMSFIKENGEWKLWSDMSPVTALLNALTEAKTDDARRRLLDGESDLITRELLFLLAGQSDRAFAQGEHTRSLNLVQSQILVAERLSSRNELSDAWHKAGILHFLQKRNEDALTAYRRSLAIDEESGRKEEMARSLSSIGLALLAQSKFKESGEHFQRALALYEPLNLVAEIARTLENIGNAHNEQGDSVTAAEFYQRCVQVYDNAKRAENAAGMVLKIARVEYDQGRDAAAIELFRQAADRLNSAGNRRSLGYVFHFLANIFYEQGDYGQALMFYQRSLQAEREAGTRDGEAGALQGIGLIHSLNLNYAAALEAYRQNLSLVQRMQKKEDVAVAWQKVAASLYSLNNYDEALTAYKESLAVREQLGDLDEIGLALLDVGLTLAAKRQYPEALDHYSKSRQLFERAGNLNGIAAVVLNTSQVHYLQGDFAKSLELASAAADFAKRAKDDDLFWQARYRAGKAHFRLTDMVSARKVLTEAISVIEAMRLKASRVQQPRFYENKIAPYLAMVDVTLGEGHGNEAYDFSQRAKIRVLTGLLQNVKNQVTKTMTPREQERERQMLGNITDFNLRLYRERQKEKPTPTRIAELQAKLQQAQTDYERFRVRLYALHPALKILRGEIKPATSAQAAALVRDAKTALLEFVETDERIYLFVFAKDTAKSGKRPVLKALTGLKIFVLDTTRGDLYARTAKFNQAIVSRDESVNSQARELYDLLLKPVQPTLEGKTQLIIAPDAISWAAPFQALRSEVNRYLLEDFAISYTPSATILDAMTNVRLVPVPLRPGQSLALLAAINPLLSADTAERIKTALTVQQIEQPVGGEKEFAEFAKLYPARHSLALTGADAAESKMKSEIGKARVIHFAAQGIHNEASPLFSLLALSPNSETKDDGLIELRELFRLNLKAELVVMEATEWAQPKTLTNRAMTAWEWAWFVAGSKSLLLSQWRADSTNLMVEFHRQMKNSGQSNSVIWRNAVRQFIARDEFKHPYFWAGFTFLGR
ncbi:MAG: CHAT domain-containing protein [Blastocatellia bacterium]